MVLRLSLQYKYEDMAESPDRMLESVSGVVCLGKKERQCKELMEHLTLLPDFEKMYIAEIRLRATYDAFTSIRCHFCSLMPTLLDSFQTAIVTYIIICCVVLLIIYASFIYIHILYIHQAVTLPSVG